MLWSAQAGAHLCNMGIIKEMGGWKRPPPRRRPGPYAIHLHVILNAVKDLLTISKKILRRFAPQDDEQDKLFFVIA